MAANGRTGGKHRRMRKFGSPWAFSRPDGHVCPEVEPAGTVEVEPGATTSYRNELPNRRPWSSSRARETSRMHHPRRTFPAEPALSVADELRVKRRTLHLCQDDDSAIEPYRRPRRGDGPLTRSRRSQPLEAVTRHTVLAHDSRVTTRSTPKRFRRQHRDVRPSPSCDPSARTAVTRRRSLQSAS